MAGRTITMLNIRLATSADTAAVRDVGDQAFRELRAVYEPSPAARARYRSSNDFERLVADEDGRVIGTVRYRIDDDCLRLSGLAVAPAARRRGIARGLVKELERIARERGCRTMALYTVRETGNVPIFERLGFEVVRVTPGRYSVGVDGRPLTEAYMERTVA